MVIVFCSVILLKLSRVSTTVVPQATCKTSDNEKSIMARQQDRTVAREAKQHLWFV